MEVEKLFKISIEYLSDYLGVLLSTIRSPKSEFPPIESPTGNSQILTSGSDTKVIKARLNPKLFSFLLISIFIGSVLNTNIRGRSPAPDFVTTLIIVIVCWLLFSSLIHVFCKVFGGRGSLVETLSGNLQVLAVIYVLSGFVAFLWGVIVTGLRSGEMATYLQGLIGEALIREPINAYFLVQLLLVLIYLPLVNRRVHKFSFSILSGRISKGTFSLALSLAQLALFYIVFFVISLMITELSKTNYHINKFPLNSPEISNIPLGELKTSVAVSSSNKTSNSRKAFKPLGYESPSKLTAQDAFEKYEKFLEKNKNKEGFASLIATVQQLKDSDVTYRIALSDSNTFSGGAEGNLTSDGNVVNVTIGNVGGPSGERFSLNSRFAHELEHARQFDSGEFAFAFDGENWKRMGAGGISTGVKARQAQIPALTDSDFFIIGGSKTP